MSTRGGLRAASKQKSYPDNYYLLLRCIACLATLTCPGTIPTATTQKLSSWVALTCSTTACTLQWTMVTNLKKKLDKSPLLGLETAYRIDDGWMMPLLASFRCLIKVVEGKAQWKVDPYKVWQQVGSRLIEMMHDITEDSFANNTNMAGKKASFYGPLYNLVESEYKTIQLKQLGIE